MSVVTRGLRNKPKAEKVNYNQTCISCDGSGAVVHGNISTENKGVMELFDDCSGCDGRGYTVKTILKRKKRKKNVEVI